MIPSAARTIIIYIVIMHNFIQQSNATRNTYGNNISIELQLLLHADEQKNGFCFVFGICSHSYADLLFVVSLIDLER